MKLEKDEKMHLISMHKKERDKRICDRIKAIILHDEGWSFKRISEVLFIKEQSIRNHIKDYEAGKKLKPENGGSFSKLSEDQTEQLIVHLESEEYFRINDIVHYVSESFGIHYTVSGMKDWLHRNGFTFKSNLSSRKQQSMRKRWKRKKS